MRIGEYLKGIDYPGRIIAAGFADDGEPVIIYAITGRSQNSRNRVLRSEDGSLFTQPFDASLVEDPSLIIYRATATMGDSFICSNGCHTETIAECLSEGKGLSDALLMMTYEPDAPSYTPRISVVIRSDGYELSIVRREDGEALRLLYRYKAERGIGHVIHTYSGDGDPIPSFSSLPVRIDIDGDIAAEAWDGLSPTLRVALYVRKGSAERIINAREVDHGKA